MEININNLVPIEKVKTDIDSIFEMVDTDGKAVLVKDNKPAYVIVKFFTDKDEFLDKVSGKRPKHTLQEAMRIVLMETEEKQMHAAELADIIYSRRLYTRKDGGKAQYNQIRARTGHYPEMFEALQGNIIKLRKGAE